MELVGAGGMGAVFVAEQQHPVRRKVALKIIKPGMDSGQVVARFEAERQALAMMEHPNIARVLDAGATDAGRHCSFGRSIGGGGILFRMRCGMHRRSWIRCASHAMSMMSFTRQTSSGRIDAFHLAHVPGALSRLACAIV
jgi:serine/threonine protein kinase